MARYKIESKNMPCQQKKAAASDTFCSGYVSSWQNREKFLKNTWTKALNQSNHHVQSIWEMINWNWFASREEIERALKYLKNNKATGADSIAAELLKNGGPNLVGGGCIICNDPAGLD
jgi:hypothetical protein